MKYMYVIAFTVLGIFVQFLAHAGIEIWYIGLLINDFARHGWGLTWAQWIMIHDFANIIFLIAGMACGYWQGMYWWKRIYGDR